MATMWLLLIKLDRTVWETGHMKCHSEVVVGWARCGWRSFSEISVHKGPNLSESSPWNIWTYDGGDWKLYPEVWYVTYILKCPCIYMYSCVYSKRKRLCLFQIKKYKEMIGRMGLFLSQVLTEVWTHWIWKWIQVHVKQVCTPCAEF